MADPVEYELTKPIDPPLYGDKPTFSYIPKDGGEPIVFPAHSTVRGEVNGKTYLEFLWEMDEDQLSSADQIFAYLRRSGATKAMKRQVLRLPEDEVSVFFRAWINNSDDEQPPPPELPPES
jgi:hypothetical protein